MYRALSPSAEIPDDSMGIATPPGTGGLSPPPPTAGRRQEEPPGDTLMELASTGSGVVVSGAPRIVGNTPDLAGRVEDPGSARGRQPAPPPPRNSVLSMLGAGPAQRRSSIHSIIGGPRSSRDPFGSHGGTLEGSSRVWPGAPFSLGCSLPWLGRAPQLSQGQVGRVWDADLSFPCAACIGDITPDPFLGVSSQAGPGSTPLAPRQGRSFPAARLAGRGGKTPSPWCGRDGKKVGENSFFSFLFFFAGGSGA
eukprot:926946-Amphidinium_carterae.1